MKSLVNKVALITGAGKGFGRATAEALAGYGAFVAVNDIVPINLDETVADIVAAGGSVKSYVQDIAKKMQVQTLVNMVLDDCGRIDILVNCAEVEPRISVLDMDDWDWQRTLDVNLTGAFLLMQSVGRVMREQGGGVMVSIGARTQESGSIPRDVLPPGRAAYLASKAGLVRLATQVAAELSVYGICVYFVNPEETEDIVAQVISLCLKGCQ